MTLSSQYYPMKVLYDLGYTLVLKKGYLKIDLQFRFAKLFHKTALHQF